MGGTLLSLSLVLLMPHRMRVRRTVLNYSHYSITHTLEFIIMIALHLYTQLCAPAAAAVAVPNTTDHHHDPDKLPPPTPPPTPTTVAAVAATTVVRFRAFRMIFQSSRMSSSASM